MINADSLSVESNSIIIRDTVIVRDTVYTIVKETPQEILGYVSVLEKTNQQLNMWWNPLGVVVAILSVLIAVLAIAVAYLIFRQGRVYQEALKEALNTQEKRFDDLIEEKNKQFDLIKGNIDNEIENLRAEAVSKTGTKKVAINQQIARLMRQREVLEPEFTTVAHSGWGERDIRIHHILKKESSFESYISLSEIGQQFVIYIKVQTTSGNGYWLGFASNEEGKINKGSSEYTVHKNYSEKVATISCNIFEQFKKGFPEVSEYPMIATHIRLRGSKDNPSVIKFGFKIIE